MKYRLLLPILCLLIISCDKDEDEPQGPTKTELLTASAWKYESGGADQNGDGTIDYTFEQLGVIPACRLDNTGTFNANGTGVTNEGATKCSGTDPQTADFTWSFRNNESALFVTGSGFFGVSGEFQVKTLNSTTLTVTKDTVVNFMSIPMAVTVIANMKH